MKNLIAYKNDPKLKAMLVKEIAWHKEQDMIIQGEYGKENGKWRGCAVGCSIHSLNLKLKTSYRYDDHSVYESALGIPIVLARLEDRIFEGLDKKIALNFPLQFAKAINVGADLSMISYKFLHWLLIDKKNGVINFTKKDNVIKSIEDVADLFKKHIAGNKVLKEE